MNDSNRGAAALQDLFSRSSTPPNASDATIGQIYSAQSQPSGQLQTLYPAAENNPESHYDNDSGRAQTPLMPGSLHDDPAVVASASNADRQSALLSLLSSNPASRPPQSSGTPPSSQQHVNGSPSNHNEVQSKLILEQLMVGNHSAGSQHSLYPDSHNVGSSPPYQPSIHESGDYHRPTHTHEAPLDLGPHPGPPAQQAQSPPEKSLFDFVSPFDALNNTGGSPGASSVGTTAATKPKPIPQQVPHHDLNYAAPNAQRNVSVDNLLESLTRGPVPQSTGTPPQQTTYDSYGQQEYGSPSQSHGFPPRKSSPARASPQKQTRALDGVGRGRNNDSPGSLQQQRKDGVHKEGSPIPGQGSGRGSIRSKRNKQNNAQSPAPQPQTVIFDVAQPLSGIQAPSDYVKSTAIALVRQDSVFLPGTTIGATSWVAYAMTRGRVRVISRSSGDRTLLQLPPVFPQSSTVVDMATYKNRLAGVTSDGGFVVWELPETITDDVPGKLLLCVQPPTDDPEREAPLQLAKWHPQDSDTLAVASENKLYLINLSSVAVLQGHPVPQYDLTHVSHVFNIPTPLVAFDFDVLHYALATISEDSTLTLWNIHDRLPYTQHKVRGEDIPSSITFVDGGVVIGRKNGTIYQLLNMTTKAVLSTIKFVNSASPDDPDMFGHAHYDSRIGTLWIANSRRESMIAFKLNFDSFASDSSLGSANYIDQVVEFSGPKPTIHFVILTADADPTGEEAHAACVAAKVPSGDLALVAFSVHAGGVDQILIRKEWLEAALTEAPEKVPAGTDPANRGNQNTSASHSGPAQNRMAAAEDEGEGDNSNRDDITNPSGGDRPERGREPKNKQKRNVNWTKGDKDSANDTPPSKGGKGDSKDASSSSFNEQTIMQALNKEMKKTEESLHTKIGRLLGKELDKQNQRLEDARAHDMQQDFARQETLLKVISTELTKNTTRVVDSAVKAVITSSVLPALEQITKQEISNALGANVGQGMTTYLAQSLPRELEKLLLRSDISGHYMQLFNAQVVPSLDRQLREAVTKSFVPVFNQQSTAMHQELLREVHSMKNEIMNWQMDNYRTQETLIKELQRDVSVLTEKLKYIAASPPSQAPQTIQPSQFIGHPTAPYAPGASTYAPPAPAPPQPGPPPPNWFNATIAAPQASHPATLPQPPAQQESQSQAPSQSSGRTPPSYPAAAPNKPEPWDNVYLDVLQTQDRGKLQALLSRTNADEILPKNGPHLVSQAVVLTLVHRLSAVVGELSPMDEEYKSSLWWLNRCIFVLRPQDKVIADFIPRTIPTVHQWLNQAKQRVMILPNAPGTFETSRTLTEMQDELIRRGARP